jgi:D-threo-aldose 1-dehydrogenase
VAIQAGAVTWSLQGAVQTLRQAAIAFPLRHPAVAGIVVGIGSAAEARRNAEAFAVPITAQVWAGLRGEGLLDERAPVD